MSQNSLLKNPISKLSDVIAREATLAILAFDVRDGHCVFLNRLANEWLELGLVDDLNGEAISKIQMNDLLYSGEPIQDRSVRPLSKEMLDNEGLFQDVLLVKRSGQRLITSLGVRHLSGEDGRQIIVVMFHDITIQKKLQREIQAKQAEIHKAYSELIEQNRQLKELDEAKDKFIALTTHELRTPLAALIATADLLRRKLYSDEKQHEQLVHTIVEQGGHLMTLVNDILDFAKIRAGKMDFYVEEASLAILIDRVTQDFESMASAAKVKIEVDVGTEVIGYVDVLRFREVLENVINNAIKYNREGGFVEISSRRGKNVIFLDVRDTGIGIPEGKLHHVFNEFETVGSLSGHQKGTGLGMPISKRYMMAMGGMITVASREGEGSTFTIEIPNTKVLADKMYGSRASWKSTIEF